MVGGVKREPVENKVGHAPGRRAVDAGVLAVEPGQAVLHDDELERLVEEPVLAIGVPEVALKLDRTVNTRLFKDQCDQRIAYLEARLGALVQAHAEEGLLDLLQTRPVLPICRQEEVEV